MRMFFTKNQHFNEVLKSIETYHTNGWLIDKYQDMLQEIKKPKKT